MGTPSEALSRDTHTYLGEVCVRRQAYDSLEQLYELEGGEPGGSQF